MTRQVKALAGFAFIIVIAMACHSSQLKRGTSSGADDSTSQLTRASTRPSEDNGGLPGYPLICKIQEQSSTESEVKCRLTAENGEQVDINNEFASWQFAMESDLQISELTGVEQPWQTGWKLQFLSIQEFRASVERSYIRFQGRSKRTGEMWEKSWLLPSVAEANWQTFFQKYRLVIHSIEHSEFPDPSACVTFFQISTNRQWLEGRVSQSGNVSLGNFPVQVHASSYSEYAHEAFINQGFWESDFYTFDPTPPFNAHVEPSWLEIDFGSNPIAIDGIRLLGTPRFYDPGECAPDVISLLGSVDGLSWQDIQGIRWLNVNTVNLYEKIW